MKNVLPTLFAASLLVSLPLAVRADSVTLTLTNSPLTAAAGTAANFQATLTALSSNSAPEYINGDNINFNGPGTPDDSAFFSPTGFYTLETFAPGQTATSGLFAIDLLASAAPGTYRGTFELLGGADANAQNNLGKVAFTVIVPTASAPEISTSGAVDGIVLLSGAVLILGGRRRLSGTVSAQAL